MGTDTLKPLRTPFATWRKAAILLGAAVVLALLGLAVRQAEFNQVGSSNHASMWIFFAAGISLYAAALIAWAAFRRRRSSGARRPS